LYDRSGFGKCPPDLQLSYKNSITAKLISDRLSELLNTLNIKPPYIIVAHSYGAMYAGYFVLNNPKLVKGLLLVDPVPRDFIFDSKRMQVFQKGIEDAMTKPASYIYKKYSGADAEIFYQLIGFDESKQLVKQFGNIDDVIPVAIISSTEMEKEHPLKEDWYESQKQWLNKNPKSEIMQVTSDHFIQLKKPRIVCNELKKIVTGFK
jgi:pimeloyl-ACP methyl ester carboxylesterase